MNSYDNMTLEILELELENLKIRIQKMQERKENLVLLINDRKYPALKK